MSNAFLSFFFIFLQFKHIPRSQVRNVNKKAANEAIKQLMPRVQMIPFHLQSQLIGHTRFNLLMRINRFPNAMYWTCETKKFLIAICTFEFHYGNPRDWTNKNGPAIWNSHIFDKNWWNFFCIFFISPFLHFLTFNYKVTLINFVTKNNLKRKLDSLIGTKIRIL